MSISGHAIPEWFTQRRYGMFVYMNIARRCDSSVLVEQGARDTVIADNRAEDCRIDTLVWESS